MRIANTIHDSIVDGPGLRYVVFTQGCSHSCPGCHNAETQPLDGGQEVSVQGIISDMLTNPLTDGLTLSGGEPMLQPEACLELAKTAHKNGLNVWCYTGFVFEQLLEDPGKRALLEEVDVLIDGPFLLSQRSLTLKWRGSENQRVLDVKKSLAQGQAVALEGFAS